MLDCFQERSDLPLESPEPVEFFSINHCFFPSSALKLDDDDDLPEALDTGRFPVSVTTRRILNFMKLLGQYLQLVRGPTWLSPSSVEADITGGSNMSSQVQPKQEASTASSKNYTFKKGDRVKYVGSLPSGFSPTQTPIRGPTYGYRGKVVLAFEENGSSKIGVRFDRAIPEGNDLGGLCEEDRGFFCAADLLRLDSSSADDIEKLAINELFETAAPSPNATNENLNVDAESGKILAENNDLRPFLQILAGSVAPALDISGSISRILDEHRAIRDLGKDSHPTISISSRRQAFKDGLRQGLLQCKNIEVSFENFPYYLSETTKNVLIASTYIHLKCDKFAKYTSDLPTVCPRVLLSGPAGSEIYQETLAKALAKHFGVSLLIVNTILLPGVQPKQEASTASSKNYTFKKGDRVKYVGSLPSGFSPTQTPIRGPTYGYRGKVVLAFEENGSSKIGVRFDRAIPEGNDLGGLCEEDRGFFCAADLLRLDSSALMTLKSSPLMNSLRHREMLGRKSWAYAAFKIKLETLPENVTQTDSRKEKSHPGGLLFTKFGSNQTALLDLAFPDEAVLVDWKQKLDRDTETLKSQSNIGSIRSVLKRLLAGVYAITLCIPPELHPRSGNTLFEVK
ncbi:UNVERIFIED_CONTAM: hypothetical protein Sradi_7117200, partial [Sesamum radiatum]